MSSDVIVRGSMLLATVAWAIGEVLMRRSASIDRIARASWTIAIVLALVHVLAAFHFVYSWSHEAAVVATAQRANDVFGRGWHGAIFVNYLFLALWAGDVCWWWASRASHALRSVRLETWRLALFVFMFVNGAIIFASGVGRLIGVVSVVVVLLGAPRWHSRRVPSMQPV